ncbi:MAG: ribonuclease III [Planctomycetota bacterium]
MTVPRSFEHENLTPDQLKRLEECEQRIGYTFKNPNYLLQALTHSSMKSVDQPCNERMEFLGDSVLGLLMTEFLFNFYGELTEGELTQIKSVVVSTTTLAAEGLRLKLDEALVVGKGVTSRKLLPTSLLANVFEAVVCAVYLDGGLDKAREFCLRNLYHQVLKVNQNRHPLNYKSLLQQHVQKTDGKTPVYRVASEAGPDHSKTFTVHAMIAKKVLGTGSGKNKKEAEQAAAQQALEQLGVLAEVATNAALDATDPTTPDAPNSVSDVDDDAIVEAEPESDPRPEPSPRRRRVEIDLSAFEVKPEATRRNGENA